MNSNSSASIARLCTIKDIIPARANLIRHAWSVWNRQEILDNCPATAAWHNACYNTPKLRDLRREAVNELAGMHGVELLGIHKRSGKYVYYCNAGDTYATTILFQGARMTVGCWGDLVERNAVNTDAQQIQESFYR